MRSSAWLLLLALFACGCSPSPVLISSGPNQGAELLPSAEVCPVSHPCSWEGLCRFDRHSGDCVIGSNEECAASIACGTFGRCAAGELECVIGSVLDCRQSTNCTNHNKCIFDITWGICVEECAPLALCEE